MSAIQNVVTLPEAATQSRKSSATTANEHRSTVRYSLHAPVSFSWIDERGARLEAYGCTRDLGPKGTYVIASQCPPRGASVSMNIFLPVRSGTCSVQRVGVEGQVLKVDTADGRGRCSGFAVRHERVVL